jgi:hypothetical protein
VLTNCIVWGNMGYQIKDTATSLTDVTYTCVQRGWSGQGNISADPLLLCVGTESLRLRVGSPCIDAGSNTAVPEVVATDLAGGPRFVEDPETNDTGDAGDPPRPIIDMGAYEYQPTAAKRLYVKAGVVNGGDGLSWATAHANLQDALKVGQLDPGVTEVWVAQGTYTPDRDADQPAGSQSRTASFQLTRWCRHIWRLSRATRTGGQFDIRDPALYITTLSGDLAGDDGADTSNNGENSYHVVTAVGVGPAAVLDGFTISGGTANVGPPDNCGAGIYMAAAAQA